MKVSVVTLCVPGVRDDLGFLALIFLRP